MGNFLFPSGGDCRIWNPVRDGEAKMRMELQVSLKYFSFPFFFGFFLTISWKLFMNIFIKEWINLKN